MATTTSVQASPVDLVTEALKLEKAMERLEAARQEAIALSRTVCAAVDGHDGASVTVALSTMASIDMLARFRDIEGSLGEGGCREFRETPSIVEEATELVAVARLYTERASHIDETAAA